MFRVKEEHLHNEHVRRMFYDIPRVGNMIAARQLNFLGKTMRGPPDRPAQQMITVCCDNTFSHASQIAKPPFPHVPPNCHGSEGARGIIMPLP